MPSNRSSLRSIAIAAAMAGAAVGPFAAIGVLLKTPLYLSTMSFVSEEGGSQSPLSSMGRLGSVFGQMGLSFLDEEGQSLAFYRRLAGSRDVLGEVIHATIPQEIGAPEETLALMWYKKTRDEDKRTFKTLKRLVRQRLSVTADERAGIVEIGVLAESPNLARWLTTTIFEELNRYNVTVRQSSATAQRRFLEQRVSETRDSLNVAETRLQDFYAGNLLIQGDPRLVGAERQLTRREDSWLEIYTTLVRELETARLDEIRDTPVLNVINHPFTPVYRDRPKRTRATILIALFGALVGGLIEVGRPWSAAALSRFGRA